MIESIRRWLSFRRNESFWNWVEDTYSLNDIIKLSTESTDASLLNQYNPCGDLTLYQQKGEERVRRKITSHLMKRYGNDIWGICLTAGGHNTDHGPTGVSCLGKLDLGFQVYNQPTFEEFMLRNALKHVAYKILKKHKK